MKDVAKTKVKKSPTKPVARLIASGLEKASLTWTRAAPAIPNRWTRVVVMAFLIDEGTNAVITMTSGKNETKALPAMAMLRSMNSTSRSRSHTRQKKL